VLPDRALPLQVRTSVAASSRWVCPWGCVCLLGWWGGWGVTGLPEQASHKKGDARSVWSRRYGSRLDCRVHYYADRRHARSSRRGPVSRDRGMSWPSRVPPQGLACLRPGERSTPEMVWGCVVPAPLTGDAPRGSGEGRRAKRAG